MITTLLISTSVGVSALKTSVSSRTAMLSPSLLAFEVQSYEALSRSTKTASNNEDGDESSVASETLSVRFKVGFPFFLSRALTELSTGLSCCVRRY